MGENVHGVASKTWETTSPEVRNKFGDTPGVHVISPGVPVFYSERAVAQGRGSAETELVAVLAQ